MRTVRTLPLLLAVPGVDTLDEEVYRYLYSRATAERRTRTDRFRFRRDACRSIVGESLVRFMLKEIAGKTLDDGMIKKNEFDRPEIPEAGFTYSVSHSGSWVICAADTGPVGADVERVHNVDRKIAERFFCPGEKAYIDAAENDAEWKSRFFTHWVLKESYIKAIGRGLNCPLDSFSCLPDSTVTGWVLDTITTGLPLHFFQVHELPEVVLRDTEIQKRKNVEKKIHDSGGQCRSSGYTDHKCATCTSQPDRVPLLQILSPEELVKVL